MKAFQLQGVGIESLQCSELPIPSAGRMKSWSAFIDAVSIIAICWLREANMGSSFRKLVPLSDAAGEVVEIGSEVHDIKQGDRVLISFMPAWESGRLVASMAKSALGANSHGTLAEYVAIACSAVNSTTRLP